MLNGNPYYLFVGQVLETKQASRSQPVGASIFVARYYNRFFPDFLAAAQRAFIAAAIRLRAAADMPRRRAGVDFLPLPGGRPGRL